MLKAELQAKHHAPFQTNNQLQVVEALRVQLMTYAYGQFPFNTPIKSEQTVLQWWTNLGEHLHASVLAVCILALHLPQLF